jgi:osmotically-inducible protein OsmY
MTQHDEFYHHVISLKYQLKYQHMKTKSTSSLAAVVATALMLGSASLLRATETDDRIVSAAQNSYVFKTYLKDDSVKTASKDGVVTLTGTVATASHQLLAQHTAAGLPGVTSVDNQLKIEGEAPSPSSNQWIILKVKSALMFHRNVSVTATEVLAEDGVVSLRGEAETEAQKELTTEYAMDVDGVKSVKNEMTVATKPIEPDRTLMEKIDDASISAQIKMSLLAHRSTSSVNTEISTVDGEVTVKGVAKNAAERSLVTKLVTDIRGVKSVVNHMTVQP